MGKDFNIVCIGGGHGLARTLESFVNLGYEPTAIITVADNGGSTGRLRVDRDIVAVGDLRMGLNALSQDKTMQNWLEHRFDKGDLAGHAQGNLAILALLETGVDLVSALEKIGEIAKAKGRVLPSTTENVHLLAKDHGFLLRGQVAVQNRYLSGRLDDIWLEPENPKGCKEAVEAIREADLITLGPGSLLTSLLPNLLVHDIARAVGESDAPIILIANTTTQPGETDGFLLQDFFEVIINTLPMQFLSGEKKIHVLAHDGTHAAGPGGWLGTRLSHDALGLLYIKDLAVHPDELPGTGHHVGRLSVALQQICSRLGLCL